jgi:predicted dienelactone hydrolase
VVDSSRVTPATDTDAESPERTIEVWLYLPDTDGPAPLVVFSHGIAGHPDKFETLHEKWAEAGYAVAAPAFLLTNDKVTTAWGNGGDGLNQPADVSFVLDRLLDESADSDFELAARFDRERVGAAGLSLGGATTYEVAVNDLARDHRFKAAIVMAGARFTSVGAGTFVAAKLPVYVLHGESDPLIPLSIPQSAYDSLSSPRYFSTLVGGGHAGPFEDEGGFEPKVPGMDQVVFDSTIAFWDRHLLDITDASDDLVASAGVDSLNIFVYDED